MSKTAPPNLGPYRLLSLVHNGHYAQLWRAIHDAKQAHFAIKLLQEQFRQSREHLTYLKHELAVGSDVVHPRIVAVHECRTDREVPFLAMEWYSATNMKTRIRQGIDILGLPVPKIVLQCAEALAYFNSRGWVHRDIKPDNFLVTDDGEVKLIDFALAHRKAGLLERLFGRKAKIQGTRSYLSPEQIRGAPLDERADLYSLACTLYELLSGKPPFSGVSSDELLNKHLKCPAPSLETVNDKVTTEFSQLLRRAMAKAPAERPKSTQQFYEQLRSIAILRRRASR